MKTSSARKGHFFPRVFATARIFTQARRRAGLSRQQLADAIGFPKDIGRELVRRLETGRYPFPAPEATRRLVAQLGLDADAVFLAQCQDFAELDRPDPKLLLSINSNSFVHLPPPGLAEAELRSWARAVASREDAAAFQLSGGLWTFQACLCWSAIRSEYLHSSGLTVPGFQPILVDVAKEDEPWIRLWDRALGWWLGKNKVSHE